jgi:hypothetical protein
MKIFYDWEFLENGNTIIPIAFGAVAEDGRECYVINKDFALAFTDNEPYFYKNEMYLPEDHNWLMTNVFAHISAQDIETYGVPENQMKFFVGAFLTNDGKDPEPRLWGFCGAYDHVATAWLWGPMVEAPHWFPYWTNDIKTFDSDARPQRPTEWTEHHALYDAKYQQLMYHARKKEHEHKTVAAYLSGTLEWMTDDDREKAKAFSVTAGEMEKFKEEYDV